MPRWRTRTTAGAPVFPCAVFCGYIGAELKRVIPISARYFAHITNEDLAAVPAMSA